MLMKYNNYLQARVNKLQNNCKTRTFPNNKAADFNAAKPPCSGDWQQGNLPPYATST